MSGARDAAGAATPGGAVTRPGAGHNAQGWPHPADFAAPPTESDLERWAEADRAARPMRLARLRARMAAAGVDGYFGVRREHMRYLTGFAIAENEVASAGDSGKFLVTADDSVCLADSRYTIQATREAPDARIFDCYRALADRWPDLVAETGVHRVAVEGGFVPHATWERLAAAAPGVELVPVEDWVEADRQTKEPAELERVAAACAVADRALASLLPSIRPGVTEAELALDLEWRMRTGGAEALAFDVACLAGAEAALPHGSPAGHPVRRGAVLLFDFGAQVAGYRSDMTRTLFVGDPTERDLGVYEVVAASQGAAIAALEAAVAASRHGVPLPDGRSIDAISRSVIEADGRWPVFGHGLGHGIGLATHELPSLAPRAAETPLPSPTVFSVEPGIYLEGETGVRIEDLVILDAAAGRLEQITRFPSGVLIVGT
ncbi:MAG: aminopeptidase P family protein [Chloroflexota bacterium]|nr:MAG: aminopeptidase P family protein [Chloroflexota bacterium]